MLPVSFSVSGCGSNIPVEVSKGVPKRQRAANECIIAVPLHFDYARVGPVSMNAKEGKRKKKRASDGLGLELTILVCLVADELEVGPVKMALEDCGVRRMGGSVRWPEKDHSKMWREEAIDAPCRNACRT